MRYVQLPSRIGFSTSGAFAALLRLDPSCPKASRSLFLDALIDALQAEISSAPPSGGALEPLWRALSLPYSDERVPSAEFLLSCSPELSILSARVVYPAPLPVEADFSSLSLRMRSLLPPALLRP